MSNKCVIIAFLCLAANLLVSGHVIRPDSTNDQLISGVHFDLKDAELSDTNVTYYSYHIHTYFLQKNENQTNEANLLRNRFIEKFNVIDCNDECDTYCPRICHWDFNTDSIGYNINFHFLPILFFFF